MFETATQIEQADILMSYKLSGKYYNLQKIRGFYEDEGKCELRIMGLDREFVITNESKAEFCKCDRGRIYLRCVDRKSQSEMLLKLTINEKDEGMSELLTKMSKFVYSPKD